jgi:hypothetical protein
MKFTTIGAAKKQTNLSYLGSTGISAKLVKNEIKNNTLTYCIYLSPAKTSGYQVCPASTPECRKGCLATSGRAVMDINSGRNVILNSRIKKTRLFFEERDFFMDWLIKEIEVARLKSIRKNMFFAVRLNGTSDIYWENIIHNGKNIFQHFPEVDFYDYTKDWKRFDNLPENHHLTLSYTGRNWVKCIDKLNDGYNVAMIFNTKTLPSTFHGYNVVNGDITDLRTKDEKGIIIGLVWKNIADKEINEEVKNSVFAIQPDNEFINR